ncbi:heme peroxidase [Thozetella sp. PMI_491]|nr:heme peroxidase [Thozetella sp. PMI_491]
MAVARGFVLALAGCSIWKLAAGSYIWPNHQTDQLENLLYEQTGFMSNNLLPAIGGCTGVGTGGHNIGAEWLRNAYHDMATANVLEGTGGMDASIAFEKDRPENAGTAFSETLGVFSGALSTRSSMADMFALAAIAAIGACSNGTLIVPLRVGRVDATGAGPPGVPQPQEDLTTHTASFARQGFTAKEMIALVACGHTIGGVHGVDFPEIVPVTNPNPNDDNTVTATEFVGNISQNPLIVGENITTRSDLRIFTSDGGGMISDMAASNDFFLSTCRVLLERMLNTVPSNVSLSDPIEPIMVKPRALDVEINTNGNMTVSGTVRIANTELPTQDSQVLIHLRPRNCTACPTPQPSSVATGTTSPTMVSTCVYPNCGPGFTYYDFKTIIPISQGVSSFTVEIADESTGISALYDNGGQGFPLSDALLPQITLSTQYLIAYIQNASSTIQLNLTAAVLNAEQFTNVTFIVPEAHPPDSPVPSFIPATVPMTASQTIPGTNYTLYTGLYSIQPQSPLNSHPYDLVATGPGGTTTNTYNSWTNIARKIVVVN